MVVAVILAADSVAVAAGAEVGQGQVHRLVHIRDGADAETFDPDLDLGAVTARNLADRSYGDAVTNRPSISLGGQTDVPAACDRLEPLGGRPVHGAAQNQ